MTDKSYTASIPSDLTATSSPTGQTVVNEGCYECSAVSIPNLPMRSDCTWPAADTLTTRVRVAVYVSRGVWALVIPLGCCVSMALAAS